MWRVTCESVCLAFRDSSSLAQEPSLYLSGHESRLLPPITQPFLREMLTRLASRLLLLCIGVIVNAASVVEVDLVFPRNETYAPTDWFPVVFAFQNAERARYLNPRVSYTIRSWDSMPANSSVTWSHDLKRENWSSHEPYFAYTHFDNFRNEGRWWLTWTVSWQSCDEDSFPNILGRGMIDNSSSWSVLFTTEESAQPVDLVAATTDKACPEELGVAINVTDETMQVPGWADWNGGDTCAVVASSTPMPVPDPCRVQVNSAVSASMSASLTASMCSGLDPTLSCPEDDKNGSQKVVVVGGSCLLVAFGAVWFLLM